MPGPGGRIGHAEVRIGTSMLMLADASLPEHPVRQFNGMLYVNDSDAVFKTAVAAGARSERQPENMFYGDRMGGVVDRWGNHWWIGTHVEDVSPEEMKRRMAAAKKT
jgi:PhnB protein